MRYISIPLKPPIGRTGHSLCPLCGVAPSGVYIAQLVTKSPVSSYLAFPSLPENRAVYFCCTFLEVAFTGSYPAPCPVVPGLSSFTTFRFITAIIRLTRTVHYTINPVVSKCNFNLFSQRRSDTEETTQRDCPSVFRHPCQSVCFNTLFSCSDAYIRISLKRVASKSRT